MQLPNRKPNRLKDYDYSSNGAYFITLCTEKRKHLLSHIVGAIHESPENVLTPLGIITEQIISRLPGRFNFTIDAYTIMSNHIHLLIAIDDPTTLRAIRESPLRGRSTISKAIGYLKMNAAKEIHNSGYLGKIWQRSFHDHIIRNSKDYERIYEYICYNPLRWHEDCFYTEE